MHRDKMGLCGSVLSGLYCTGCRVRAVLFVSKKLQLVLVFGEKSLESEVFSDHRQHLFQQLTLSKALRDTKRVFYYQVKYKNLCRSVTKVFNIKQMLILLNIDNCILVLFMFTLICTRYTGGEGQTTAVGPTLFCRKEHRI